MPQDSALKIEHLIVAAWATRMNEHDAYKPAAFALLMISTACGGTLVAGDREGELAWREVTGTRGAEVLGVGSAIGSIAWSPDSKPIGIQTRQIDQRIGSAGQFTLRPWIGKTVRDIDRYR